LAYSRLILDESKEAIAAGGHFLAVYTRHDEHPTWPVCTAAQDVCLSATTAEIGGLPKRLITIRLTYVPAQTRNAGKGWPLQVVPLAYSSSFE
jgi:hypothetical protein